MDITIGGVALTIRQYGDPTEIPASVLEALASDDWRMEVEALPGAEHASNEIDSLHRIPLAGNDALVVYCEQGVPISVEIIDGTMEASVLDLDHDIPDEELLVEWGLTPDIAAAKPESNGPFRVWRQPNYYSGTCGAPLARFDRHDETDEIMEWDTHAEAQAYVDAYYTEPSVYDGIPQCNVLSHGQASSDTLTITTA